MRGRLYIDGVDAYEAFGAWITEGGYNDLLAFPGLVEPERNDWMEEDGVEVDLENPTLKPKEVSITFVSSVPFRSAYDFIHKLGEPGYHVLRIPALEREWRLRLLSHPDNEEWDTLTSLTLRFAEDVPERPSAITPEGGGAYVPASGYELDGVPLDRYGIVVMEGRNDVLRSPTAKTNLSRTILNVDGRTYDTGQVVFQAKDVTFKCLLNAVSVARFWQCYDAFFSDLTHPGERSLYVDYTGEEYPCHYKGTSGWQLISLSGRMVVAFDLTLTFTSFRVGETEYLLASEDGELIETEDGGYLIDLR